jgi:hypothetical protein
VRVETEVHTRVRPSADLSQCVGYRVDSSDGWIGSVAAVLPSGDEADTFLLVQSGRTACSLSAISFAEVERVDLEARRVLLRDPSSTESVPRGACECSSAGA